MKSIVLIIDFTVTPTIFIPNCPNLLWRQIKTIYCLNAKYHDRRTGSNQRKLTKKCSQFLFNPGKEKE